MAKVKNLDKVSRLITRFFREDIQDKKTVDEIKEFALNRIRSFTRSGKSISGTKPVKLKPLSESYKDVRRGATKWRTINGKRILFEGPDEKINEVDQEFFSPEKSNLTFTGQMLKALRAVVTKSSRSVSIEIDVEPSRRHGKYEKLDNKTVAGYVAQNGRPFIGLDDTGVDRVRRILLANIRKSLVKLGLK